MLRLCLKNVCVLSRTPLQTITSKEIKSNLNGVIYPLTSIQRNYGSKTEKDTKMEHIYYGPLTPQIRAVKLFSLGSSIAGLIAQPIIIREAATIGSTSLLIALCSVVGFFTFITPILLHIVTKKYVTDIHYEPDTSTYKAITLNFFLAKKQHKFKVEDVTVPDIPGMFTTLHAKGKPLFIEARFFSDPIHYAKMMGYDKPIDFKLGEQSDDTTKQN